MGDGAHTRRDSSLLHFDTNPPTQADDRFFWNKFLQARLIDITISSNPDQDVRNIIMNIISRGLISLYRLVRSSFQLFMDVRCAMIIGPAQFPDTPLSAVEIRQSHIGRIPFDLALISRRARYRAGTRYFTRGIDSRGHVANFNETEQIILIDSHDDAAVKMGMSSQVGYGGFAEVEGTTKLSFVQTRGSVPVYWAEVNNLRYKPDLVIMDREDTVSRVPIVGA